MFVNECGPELHKPNRNSPMSEIKSITVKETDVTISDTQIYK